MERVQADGITFIMVGTNTVGHKCLSCTVLVEDPN